MKQFVTSRIDDVFTKCNPLALKFLIQNCCIKLGRMVAQDWNVFVIEGWSENVDLAVDLVYMYTYNQLKCECEWLM